MTPPCESCQAVCCHHTLGHSYAVALDVSEHRQFRDVAIELPAAEAEALVLEPGEELPRVLPYVDGKCVMLGDDNRCTAYETRPRLCRQFNCMYGYAAHPNRHASFLENNPQVPQLIELERPGFAAGRKREQAARLRNGEQCAYD